VGGRQQAAGATRRPATSCKRPATAADGAGGKRRPVSSCKRPATATDAARATRAGRRATASGRRRLRMRMRMRGGRRTTRQCCRPAASGRRDAGLGCGCGRGSIMPAAAGEEKASGPWLLDAARAPATEAAAAPARKQQVDACAGAESG
jgi:hypothetical protein